MNTTSRSSDVLRLLYSQQGTILYGAVQFFKDSGDTGPPKPSHQSAPFVIKQTLDDNEAFVFGSVSYLIQDIIRLLDDIDSQVKNLDVQLRHLIPQGHPRRVVTIDHRAAENRTYFEFTRALSSALVLLSTQVRNLTDVFPRFKQARKIELYDTSGVRAGTISLKDLLDQLVHNRYFFLDGEYVHDLFSSNPRPKSPITRTFMGYKFSWLEYVDVIKDVAKDVSVRDLTGLLRGGISRLSPDSPHSDVVFLIQNLESFSYLFGRRVPDRRWYKMLSILFDDEGRALLEYMPDDLDLGDGDAQQRIEFQSPGLKISEVLSDKKFTIYVRCKFTLLDSDGVPARADKTFRQIVKTIDQDDLLSYVAGSFGDDSLLDWIVGGSGSPG